ncbi:MAG: nucleotidyltransferase domain-containing protein [Defluviitaleaceae bacterium]|nr:nucleotidyltransferase domain-containing protein [Defluviitaleaceae bacterium]
MLEQLEALACEVLKQYPIKRAALFGSAARRDITELSDIDMIIEFQPNSRGLDFFGLRVDLEEALGRSVDLITWNALSKAKINFKQNVENEARLIYEC